jgi:hypothetical protein
LRSSACTDSSVSISKPEEAAGKDFEAARHHAVARQDIGEAVAEQARDQLVEEAVAGPVAGTIGGLRSADAYAHHHVGIALDQRLDEPAGRARIVGQVSVGQHIDVGVDVGEHAPHDVALALVGLEPHDRGGGLRHLGGAVGGVVVVYVDVGGRQRATKVLDHLGDGGFLIMTRQQNCDRTHAAGGMLEGLLQLLAHAQNVIHPPAPACLPDRPGPENLRKDREARLRHGSPRGCRPPTTS